MGKFRKTMVRKKSSAAKSGRDQDESFLTHERDRKTFFKALSNPPQIKAAKKLQLLLGNNNQVLKDKTKASV
jgi:hypothetical protein